MTLNVRPKCVLRFGLALSFLLPIAAFAQALPAGRGADEFRRMCSSCHNASTATNQRKTPTDWNSTVHDMVTRGAQGSAADIESVVVYLSANFGTDKPRAVGSVGVQAPAVEKTVMLGAAEVAKGNELMKANGCLSCHRVGGAGSYVGPDLSDIGSHRTLEQINKVLISPSKEVLPENRMVRMVTRSGQKVEGRILNQDGLSVQLIDGSSHLRSFQRSELREFTIVDQNPMPSYAKTMSAEDLATLTRYLGSLKEVNLQ